MFSHLLRAAAGSTIVITLAACGGPAGPGARPSSAARAEGETSGGESASLEVERLRADADASQRRARELEARLALRTAEVGELRDELEEARVRPTVVRIGESTTIHPRSRGADREDRGRPDDDSDLGSEPDIYIEATGEPAPAPARPSRDEGPRPLLRLYGAAPTPDMARPAMDRSVPVLAGPTAPAYVPAPPPSALGRLPVASGPVPPSAVPAIPLAPLTVLPPTGAPASAGYAPPAPPVAPAPDAAATEYHAALALVSARSWDDALSALGRFVAHHPAHPYADNAVYWRAEVFFARRQYARAVSELELLVTRYPDGNKVPDALLRMGVCFERLGQAERATEMFRRVREEHPDTVAARLAAREET